MSEGTSCWGLSHLLKLSPSVHDGWMAGVAQAIVPVRTLDRQILPPTTAEVSSTGRDLLRLSVSEHKLYRADSGAECRNRNTNNSAFSRNPEKRSLDDALMIRHTYVYNQFLSSLSISFRFEEIGQCSWQQLDQDHDTFSGQRSVFAPETLTDAERLGTRSWPVWPLHSSIAWSF